MMFQKRRIVSDEKLAIGSAKAILRYHPTIPK
ncbi:unnamed protein product, partial [marine sediment metagenome]